jgi:Nucleotidyl transferase AbiEii toxin, Type IV TA system
VRATYATPNAFRRALKDGLRAHAAPRGPWPLADLQRQFAYDRLLARLYQCGSGWVVKGATALLAREIAVRHTIDLDVYRWGGRAEAERDLREAAGADLGDWFRFEVGAGVPIVDGDSGVRLTMVARIGAVEWARFHVDVVASTVRMTGIPDDVPPLTPIDIPGLDRAGYRAYPLVDHIADKTCAVVERYGPAQRPSTRYKDLVDLVTLARHVRVDADEQSHALRTEAGRRGIPLPATFDVPDRGRWRIGYAAEARRAAGYVVETLEEALAVVGAFLDPILAGTATGCWSPERGAWAGSVEEAGAGSEPGSDSAGQQEPAVDDDGLAGEPGGVVGDQERHDAADVLRNA